MDFLLPIFPAAGLSSSVITTVWIGMIVVCFLNLRFGWVLSGLVVPGYLVPLLILKPWGAAVILVESAVTYALVWLYSERFSRLLGGGSVFGRDRFFALMLVAVLVRVVADGWIWPMLASNLEMRGITSFDFRSNLQSFGLVIIALTANLFWKTGFVRGLLPLSVSLGATFVIVRYGLMEFTNFSISNISYMYEDLATSILASPKSYIVLITAAAIASRMNLHYGWDFNGILLPSLLALQWYQPEKILWTFVEAFIIVAVATRLLKSRWFANRSIEGARKLLLFFNIGFAFKLLLGFMLPLWLPAVKITDYYAFGYVLSALLAVKIYDKDILPQLTRATIQTSAVAVLVATVIGFGLSKLPRSAGLAYASVSPIGDNVLSMPAAPVALPVQEQVRSDKLLFYRGRGEQANVPSFRELSAFEDLLLDSRSMRVINDVAYRQQLAAKYAALGFELLLLPENLVYLRESEGSQGRGIYVLNPQAPQGLIIEAPTAAVERGIEDVATALFLRTHAFALALSTSNGVNGAGTVGDSAADPRTYFHTFHRSLARANVLQVRHLNPAIRESLTQAQPADAGVLTASATLWIKQSLPKGLDLSVLEELSGSLQTRFENAPFTSRQRIETHAGFAELLLDDAGVRTLLARSRPAQASTLQQSASEQHLNGFLTQRLLVNGKYIAERGTGHYLPPTTDELLLLDVELFTPLARVVSSGYSSGNWSPAALEELAQIAQVAAGFDYQVILHRDTSFARDFVILVEADQSNLRHWGAYVFRAGGANEYLVEVPRPLFELGSFEHGISLFEQMSARALLLAGSHPAANADISADVLHPGNRLTVFNLVNQVLLRERPIDQAQTVIQTRAFGNRADVTLADTDVIVSVNNLVMGPNTELHPMVESVLNTLENSGLSYSMAGVTPHTAGYENGFVPPSRYSQASQNVNFIGLRLSPRTRFAYREQLQNRLQSVHFDALNIPTRPLDLRAYLSALQGAVDAETAAPSLLDQVQQYQRRPDIVTLRKIQLQWGMDWKLERFVDSDSLAAFLSVSNATGAQLGLFNLEPRQSSQITQVDLADVRDGAIDRFISGSHGALLFTSEGS